MRTRFMGRLMIGLGVAGWLAGIVSAALGVAVEGDGDRLARHLLAGVLPTLVLVPVLVWLILFATLTHRAIERHTAASAGASRRPLLLLLASCGVALILTLANFLVGFQSVSGDASPQVHAVTAVVWLVAVAVSLVLSYRVLGVLESAADGLALEEFRDDAARSSIDGFRRDHG